MTYFSSLRSSISRSIDAPCRWASGKGSSAFQGTGKREHASRGTKTLTSEVNGFAKKFAGKVFNNPKEVEFGEKKLAGEI